MLSRRLICIISLVLALSLVGNVQAVTATWTDGSGDHLWSTLGNWSVFPTPADWAKIKTNPGATVASAGAVALKVHVGYTANSALTVDGGILTTVQDLAFGKDDKLGILNMISGTINCGKDLEVGYEGPGLVNMTGGTIIATDDLMIPEGGTTNTAEVNLDGGTIIVDGDLIMAATGSMDITGGTLILDGDVTSTINSYITNVWITAYDRTGTIHMDYNTSNSGKTTVTATENPPAPPGQATDPSPAGGAGNQSINVNLSWTDGIAAVSHDVYFGTDPTPDATEFQGSRTTTIFGPGTLAYGTTYYWRIDEINPQGTTTGVVWSFTTESPPPAPGQATNPSPASGAGDQSVYSNLNWTAGTGVVSLHDVYFGTDPTPDATEFRGNRAAAIFNPGTLANGATYYWRIDEIGPGGIMTTGVVWSFTTEVATILKLWDDDSVDHLWSTPVNWYPDAVPDTADNVRINIADATVSVFDQNAICYTMQMQSPGGQLDVSDTLYGELAIENSAYLYKGLVKADTLIMDTNNLLDVSRGELILDGDHVPQITGYIEDGLVTAYGGDSSVGIPIVDFDDAANQSRLAALAKAGCLYLTQSGCVQVTDFSLDVPIEPVADTKRAFVLLSKGAGFHTGSGSISQNADEVLVKGYLSTTDNIHISRSTNINSTWVSYQVIECLDEQFKVHRGGGTLATGSTSEVINIGATVIPSNCLAYVTADSNSPIRSYYHESMLTARVSSSTQVTIERESAIAASPQIRWIVVEFDPSKLGSIQHGSVSVSNSTSASPETVAISTIDPSSSLLIFQSRPGSSTANETAVAGNISSPTQIKFYKYKTNGYADVEWYVIDFGYGSAQRGMLDRTAYTDTTWGRADATLSPAVYTKRMTMFFHSMSCDQTNNNIPRSLTTAKLASTSHLIVRRYHVSNYSNIEWQVIEFPYTVPIRTADMNEDGRVGNADFAILCSQWQDVPGMPSADVAPAGGDNFVDIADLLVLAEEWPNDSVIDGAIAYWNLDETAGSIASDSSGSGYDGTLTNMDDSDWVAGKTGNALDFDGVNDYVTVGGVCAEIAGGDVTISAWVKAPALNPDMQFIISINTASGDNRLLCGTPANTATLSLGDTAWHDTTATVIDNTWHHIAVVLKDSSNTITVYVDGSNVLGFTSTVSVAAGDVLSFGQEYDGIVTSDFYNGLLDEVRVYGRALSTAEIAILAQ